MFPRAHPVSFPLTFPYFSTAPSRFLSSFPRKLRGNQLVWAPNQPNRQNTGLFCRFPRFRLRFWFLPQTSSQTRGNSRVARMEHQTSSSFPGNFRKRKDQSAGDPLVSFFSVCSSYEHTPVGELLTGFAMSDEERFLVSGKMDKGGTWNVCACCDLRVRPLHVIRRGTFGALGVQSLASHPGPGS